MSMSMLTAPAKAPSGAYSGVGKGTNLTLAPSGRSATAKTPRISRRSRSGPGRGPGPAAPTVGTPAPTPSFRGSSTVGLPLTYRIYLLDDQDQGGMELAETFPDDAAALRYAEALLPQAYAAEIWEGDRLVARLGGEYIVRPTAAETTRR